MSLITVSGVTKYFGADKVLDSVSFSVDRTDRIGLVGRNGGGKSTLLNILSGVQEPDEGGVGIASGARVAMLTQDPAYDPENTLWDEVKAVLRDLVRAGASLRDAELVLEKASASGDSPDEALSRYAEAEDAYRRAGGYDWQVRLSTVLTGLGFATREFKKKMREFSSGQRVRTALAKVLLEEPDLLLLDEPTNHLDIDAAEWLEERLKAYSGAVIAVSHDRYFLNSTCNRILELENYSIAEYRGNYDQYIAQREFRREQQEKEYEAYRRKAEELKDYIRRYQANQRAVQAKSREKWLARLGTVTSPQARRSMAIEFRPENELGKQVFRTKGLEKRYGGKTVFSDVAFTIFGNDRVGIVGKNGAGKTTLLKVLMGMESPTLGSVWTGPSADIGYFWQDLDTLVPENTVIDELSQGTGLLPGEARHMLGAFLFSRDDVFKRVSVLSGGERNRLTLAKLVLSGCNVLVLDEPTNHLDVESKEALARALVSFSGCVVFVTHDRQFLDDVATRIFEIEDGRLELYKGNYLVYREEKRQRLERARRDEARKEPQQAGVLHPGERVSGSVRHGDPVRRRLAREAWAKTLAGIEAEVEELEKQRVLVEARLADPEIYRTGESLAIISQYQQLERDIKAKYEEWETLEMNPPM